MARRTKAQPCVDSALDPSVGCAALEPAIRTSPLDQPAPIRCHVDPQASGARMTALTFQRPNLRCCVETSRSLSARCEEMHDMARKTPVQMIFLSFLVLSACSAPTVAPKPTATAAPTIAAVVTAAVTETPTPTMRPTSTLRATSTPSPLSPTETRSHPTERPIAPTGTQTAPSTSIAPTQMPHTATPSPPTPTSPHPTPTELNQQPFVPTGGPPRSHGDCVDPGDLWV
jgi:hypothetical protein